MRRKTSRFSRRCIACAGVLAAYALVQGFLAFSYLSAPRECEPVDQNRPADASNFIVRINTFRRHERADRAAAHYAGCRGVREVRVVWSEKEDPPSDIGWSHCSLAAPVIIERFGSTSLNNRFSPIPNLSSGSAIFSVDDDVLVDCRSLQEAHRTYLTSYRGAIVGFVPRVHAIDRMGNLAYRHYWTVLGRGKYSIILTKAAFLDADLLNLYTNSAPRESLALVERIRNCEDLLMQFVASNATGLPPILVEGFYADKGALSGISTSSGHAASRSECLSQFTSHFGRVPLVASSAFQRPMRPAGLTSLFVGKGLRPPTWLELLTPPARWSDRVAPSRYP